MAELIKLADEAAPEAKAILRAMKITCSSVFAIELPIDLVCAWFICWFQAQLPRVMPLGWGCGGLPNTAGKRGLSRFRPGSANCRVSECSEP
jgi:hypothetical protein